MAIRTRGWNSLKLLGSLRGSGVLKAGEAAVEVRYHLDRYESRNGQVATGEVDGDLSVLPPVEESLAATLVLENGSEIACSLSNVEADGADVDVQGSVVGE